MNAVTYSQYGAPEVAKVERVPMPVVGERDVLVRVEATSMSAADAAARLGAEPAARLYFGLRKPRFPVLGSDFSGTVVAVGSMVTQFAVGNAVVGAAGAKLVTHAEIVRLPETAALVKRPANLSAIDAVGVSEGGLTALHFVRDVAAAAPGKSVLIIGASGAVGSSAVQLAAHFGARVTAVCSAKNAQLVSLLGASEVIDYASTDFTSNGKRYDVIFDAVAKRSYHATVGSLTPTGRYLSTVPKLSVFIPILLTKWSKGKRARIAFAGLRPTELMRADLVELMRLAANGNNAPVSGGTFSFHNAAEAYRLVDSGRKTGTVVLVP